jgi:hypothetical protein
MSFRSDVWRYVFALLLVSKSLTLYVADVNVLAHSRPHVNRLLLRGVLSHWRLVNILNCCLSYVIRVSRLVLAIQKLNLILLHHILDLVLYFFVPQSHLNIISVLLSNILHELALELYLDLLENLENGSLGDGGLHFQRDLPAFSSSVVSPAAALHVFLLLHRHLLVWTNFVLGNILIEYLIIELPGVFLGQFIINLSAMRFNDVTLAW